MAAILEDAPPAVSFTHRGTFHDHVGEAPRDVPLETMVDRARAFSGRWARGTVNDFVCRHPDAPPAYPEINNATCPIRAAAATRGDVDRMSLWAGSGFRAATDRPAAEVVAMLCADTG